ncbi:MAG: PAS domain S-box protein [Desulfobacterales bacterium]|nr:PAS domain S-box protein [Desulfobacterales bacterium]
MTAFKNSDGEAREYAESIINTVRDPLIILDQDLRVISASRSFYDAFTVKPEETEGQLIYDLDNKQWDIPELRDLLETLLPQKTTLDDYQVEQEFADLGRRTMLVNAREIHRKSGKERLILLAIEDITERKQTEKGLQRIEWMLSSRQKALYAARRALEEPYVPPYGDLTKLNTSRKILDAAGEETLKNIADDFLDLLETSVAVYERNGDYALGLFSSDWCRFMDQASYRLCKTEDSAQALSCGKWLCHESCWNTAKQSIATAKPVDMECEGGIRLYAVPIFAGGEVIGTINVGYGDPPTDVNRLSELAKKYGVDIKDLVECSNAYEIRPPFIIELAKRRIRSAAYLIGEIVERKQAEQALQQSESYYRAIFETSGTAMFIIEEDTTISHVNTNFETLSGYSRQEVEGKKSWTEFIHADDVGWMKQYHYLRRGNPDPAPHQYEFRFITRHGEKRNIFLAVDMIAGTNRSIASCIDITERKQAEKAVAASEEKYRTILDSIEDGYFEVDTAGNFTFFNDSACRILGYSSAELMGMNFRELTDKNNTEKVFQAFNQVFTTGASIKTFDWALIRKDGEKCYVDTSVSLMRDANGKAIGFRGVARDVTDRKKAEAEKEKLQAQLNQAQKMESVGRLAGGVAHDFNNKLTIINGYAEMAIDMMDPSDPLRKTIQEIYTAGKKSADIVRQLMAFARQQTINPVQLDLNETISGMLKMLQRLIGENIDLVWHPGNNLWPVKLDPSQVDQTMANLAVNARDAIADVGKIKIETNNVEVDDDYCNLYPYFVPGQYVMLSVSDDGSGMDKETLANLFEPFFTTKEIGKGTGLGMAMIYGIVKQHNGFINVDSEPGKGTTVKIYLPRLETEESALEPAKESTPTRQLPTGTETILIVEDEIPVLQMSRQILERLGYTVQTAGNPSAALQLFEAYNGTIHLLITDVIMPEMNGRDLASRMAMSRPGLKILYMSGYTADVIAHKGVIDEGVKFIQKPFSMQELAVKVRDAIGQ